MLTLLPHFSEIICTSARINPFSITEEVLVSRMSVRHTINKTDTMWVDSMSMVESSLAAPAAGGDGPSTEKFNEASMVLPTAIIFVICKYFTYDEVCWLNRKCRCASLDRLLYTNFHKKFAWFANRMVVEKMSRDIVSHVPKYLILLEDQYRFMGDKWNGSGMHFLEKRNRYQRVIRETLGIVLFNRVKYNTLIGKMCRCAADGHYRFTFHLKLRFGTSSMCKILGCDKFGDFDVSLSAFIDENGDPFYVTSSVTAGDSEGNDGDDSPCKW